MTTVVVHSRSSIHNLRAHFCHSEITKIHDLNFRLQTKARAAKSHLLSVSHDRAHLSYHAVRINVDQPRPYPTAALSASISGDPMRRLLTATRMRTVRLDVRNDGTF